MIKINYQWVFGLLITILITGLLFYFSLSSKSTTGSYLTIEYQKSLKTFEHKFIDHFPKEIENNEASFMVSEDIERSHPGIKLKTEIDSDNLDTLLNYLKLNSIARATSSQHVFLGRLAYNKNTWATFSSRTTSPSLDDTYSIFTSWTVSLLQQSTLNRSTLLFGCKLAITKAWRQAGVWCANWP